MKCTTVKFHSCGVKKHQVYEGCNLVSTLNTIDWNFFLKIPIHNATRVLTVKFDILCNKYTHFHYCCTIQ